MTEPHVSSALNLLAMVRAETSAIGVAVSFGKDSLATLDLCCRVFSRVEAYYLYRVRELEIVEQWAREVFDRHGVTVRMYPHFDLARCYRHAVLQPHYTQPGELFAAHHVDVPRVNMVGIEATFCLDADVEWLAMGWRRTDSLSRALIMKQTGGYDPKAKRVFPLRTWRRQQVYDYLAARGIPAPPTLGRKEQGGLDFHPEALRALSDRDRTRWFADFPYAGIQLVDAEPPANRKRSNEPHI